MKPMLGRSANVPDFISGITREICEERGIGGKIGSYHAGRCLVRAATGVTTSNDGVTAPTLPTLHQFPDLGMNHAHRVDGHITQEWIVFDEVSIWKQIPAHQEGRAGA